MDADKIVEWDVSRAGQLLALVDVAYPDDRLTLDELQAACWGTARSVVGFADGSGAVSVRFEGTHAVIGVLAASAQVKGQVYGQGESQHGRRAGGQSGGTSGGGPGCRALVEAAKEIAARAGAERVVVGGPVPDHLWPGLTDVESPAIGDLTALGFRRTADVGVLHVPTTFRAPVPDGFRIERVVDEDLVARVGSWIGDFAPSWSPVVDRAVAQATCLVAVSVASDEVEGLVAHSVGRDGWIGPMAVSPGSRRNGLGTALLAEACRDLLIAGLSEAPLACPSEAEVEAGSGGSPRDPGGVVLPGAPWPVGFLTSVGARPWQTFRRYGLTLV